MLPIRVIIADDHDLVIEGLKAIFRNSTELELLCTAFDGEQLIELTRKYHPDIVITGIMIPKMNGVQAIKTINGELPDIGIIALTANESTNIIVEVISAGARGYLNKSVNKEDIIKAVKKVYNGEVYYCKKTNKRLAEIIKGQGIRNNMSYHNVRFSEREKQIIFLMCQGLPSKIIAHRLEIKTRTVERYRDSIMSKLNVHNVAAVVAYAITNRMNMPVESQFI